MLDLIEILANYIVFPLMGVLYFLHTKLHSHEIKLAVLEAATNLGKQAHERENKELRDTLALILAKINSIEEFLRK